VRAANPGRRVRLFVMDEARVGQQGTLTRVWAPTGSRPTAVTQCEYDWLYLWAAAEPATGASHAILTPTVDAGLMGLFLEGLAGLLAPDEHAVLVLDNAGWHVARALKLPANVTLMFLPPYSPELNPAERLWQWLRSHHLSNRVFADYDDLLNKCESAWKALDPATIKSICACSWAERALQA
jgi:transposase